MNKKLISTGLISILITLASCTKDKEYDNDPDPVISDTTITSYTVTMSAQNESILNQQMHDAVHNGSYRIAYYNTKIHIVDMVCYFDESGTDGMVIASPNNTRLTAVTAYSAFINPDSLMEANNTEFRKTVSMTESEFNKLIDKNKVAEIFNSSGTSAGEAKNLAAGTIYALKTQSGIYGVMRVDEIQAPVSATSAVKVSLKIQKQ